MKPRPARPAAPLLALLLFATACATRRPPPSSPASSGAPNAPGQTPVVVTGPGWSEEGFASWYGGDDGFEGKPTASGEIYDSSQMTAAHRELPLGTVVDVTNLENGKSVRVRINDRGPFARGRILDLSQEAARRLDLIGPGTGRVRVTLVAMGPAPTPASSRARWVVQVGSFADPARAARQAEKVRGTGRDASLEPYQGLTRVHVGPYATREDAESALASLEAAGFEGIVVPK